MSESVTLTELLAKYVQGRDIERVSLKTPKAANRSFGLHLHRPPTVGDLRHEPVNEWLAEEIRRVTRRTARG